MRVTKKSSSSSLFPADKAARRDRAGAFRRAHRVGEVVRGRLVRWEGDGLAWVTLDDQPLLARLPAETPLGAPLAFLITALAPEIVLKRLSGQGGGTGQGRLVADFVAARAAFEATWRAANPGPLRLAPDGRREAFLEAVARDRQTSTALASVLAAAAELNRALPQGSRLVYAPWLAPGARDLEMTVLRRERESGNFTEIALSGVLDKGSPGAETSSGPGPGAFQIRLLVLDDGESRRAGVRVLAEHPDPTPDSAPNPVRDLADRLARAVENETPETTPAMETLFHGLEPLPRSARGGVLAELVRA